MISIGENDIKVVWACCGCLMPSIHTLDYNPINNKPKCPECGSIMSYVETLVKKPRIIVFMEGRFITDIMSDLPAEVRTIDYDVKNTTDDTSKIILPGSTLETEVVVGRYSLEGEENMDDFFDQKEIG
jgi:hypothetical protein